MKDIIAAQSILQGMISWVDYREEKITRLNLEVAFEALEKARQTILLEG